MEHRALGASGLKVSTLCLGGMTFGEADEKSFMHKVGSPEKEAHEIVSRAVDAGLDFIDVADVYGQDGLSERVLGNWFEATGRRNDVILATKFRFRMWGGPNGTGASRYHIVRAAEDSLRRLKTDRIDLYQIHMQDLDAPEEETLRALDDLVRAGKVQYIGCSNYAAYRLMDSLWISRSGGLERFVAAQMQYSLIVRDIEREHVPLCRRHGLGILPWSPLGGGFLTGKFRKDQPLPDGARLTKNDRTKELGTDRNWKIVDELVAVATEIEATPSQVAVAWLLRKPAVTSVIIGARTVAQLDDNLKAAELKLPDAAMARLDAVSAIDLGYPYAFMHRVQKDW